MRVRFNAYIKTALNRLHFLVSEPVTTVQLCVIGVLGGIIAAAVIIVFRGTLSLWHQMMLGGYGNYQALDDWQRLLLPIIAVVLILLVAATTGFKHYRLGIPFVIHRLKIYYGHIPFRSSINQFFGGILALGSGFVVGKEGPTVHLAAATSHYIGRWLGLPFNALRILAGCGIAAGIAAAFNTPFAAIIFVMEVVLREYKVHVFVPVMLAAACGSVITRAVFGDVYELSFLSFTPLNGFELMYLVFFGFCIGIFGALFNHQLMFIMRTFRQVNMFSRLLIAALITGIVGYFYPQALGAEFINIQNLFSSQFDLPLLISIFVAKFVLASVAIALGIPGGIIGAVMVIGMLLGVILMAPLVWIDSSGNVTTYALLGLAGFLATVLHAPMAALSAAMELAANSKMILPAIIVIVSAFVTSRQLLNNRSIFIQQLDFQNLPYTTTAVRDLLQNTGVLALMDKKLSIKFNQSKEDLYKCLQEYPETKLIAINSSESKVNAQLVGLNVDLTREDEPLSYQSATLLSHQHTLADVYDILQAKRGGAIIVVNKLAESEEHFMSATDENYPFIDPRHLEKGDVMGIITWDMIHTYLLRQQH